MRRLMFAVAVLSMLILSSGVAQAEPYISGYLGAAFPHDADVTDNSGMGLTPTLEFDTGLAYGAKLGYWFTEQGSPFFGVQFDVNRHTTEATESANFSSLFGIPAFATAVGDVTVTAYTFNAILRKAEGKVKPYVGVGVGWFTGEFDTATVTVNFPTLGMSTSVQAAGVEDTTFGWQFLAGVDLELNDKVSLFGEYKYSNAEFSFDTSDVDYGVSQLYGGVSYHF